MSGKFKVIRLSLFYCWFFNINEFLYFDFPYASISIKKKALLSMVLLLFSSLQNNTVASVEYYILLKFFTYLLFLINFAIRLKNKYLSKFTHKLVLK